MTRWLGKRDVRSLASGLAVHWPRLVEWLLIALILVQIIRLFWVMITPVGPLGDWQGRRAEIAAPSAREAIFRSFDPFYPATSGSGGAQNVTSLALSLYGVRINEGSGLGSAILAGTDGVQTSYAVGDEIAPGVHLKAVLFDHVIIDRGGVEESIFLDQSVPAPPAADAGSAPQMGQPAPPASGNAQAGASGSGAGVTAEALKASIGFGPRMSGGRISGIILTSKGPGFEAAGFRPGDVVTQINGRPITSAVDLSGLQQALTPGARVSLMVERGAQVVPIALLVQEQ